mmetsp:Transcript_39735/g.97361  ORF Transcript_39735/g.97361 Transcript_39735/m.97361 type:complete len:352 (-) Transcript_39735:227-1282(-)
MMLSGRTSRCSRSAACTAAKPAAASSAMRCATSSGSAPAGTLCSTYVSERGHHSNTMAYGGARSDTPSTRTAKIDCTAAAAFASARILASTTPPTDLACIVLIATARPWYRPRRTTPDEPASPTAPASSYCSSCGAISAHRTAPTCCSPLTTLYRSGTSVSCVRCTSTTSPGTTSSTASTRTRVPGGVSTSLSCAIADTRDTSNAQRTCVCTSTRRPVLPKNAFWLSSAASVVCDVNAHSVSGLPPACAALKSATTRSYTSRCASPNFMPRYTVLSRTRGTWRSSRSASMATRRYAKNGLARSRSLARSAAFILAKNGESSVYAVSAASLARSASLSDGCRRCSASTAAMK